MPAKTSPQSRLADAALRLLLRKSWTELGLADVARAAKIPLAQLQAIAPAKHALLGLILTRLGEKVAATYKPDRKASPRDRLFDVGMAWFDVLGQHKPAVRALADGVRRDPLLLIAERGKAIVAAEWLMTLAGVDNGAALPLRAAGFALALARAVPVWLDDDQDLTKTMAQLDADLARAERVLGKA